MSVAVGRVLLIPHVGKPGISEMAREISRWLEGHGVGCCLLEEDAGTLGLDLPAVTRDELPGDVDLAISLGGDGTMLHSVDIMYPAGIPVAGINIGKLGFLTAAEVHQAREAISMILKGHFQVSRRVMVGCTTITPAGESRAYRALNEIVIAKLARERLIHLTTYINGSFFMKYSGDGLIVSSATGSTAYSLSAGGPVVAPELRCLLLTPVCAHMLFGRPMVLEHRDRIEVVVEQETERLALSIDGRENQEVPPGTRVEFYALKKTARILELEGSSFYQTLRRKFLVPPDCENL